MTGWRVLLLLSLPFLASAGDRTIAQFVHKAWTVKDGAPASIWDITQTNDGYLWLGSSEGLYRFDGIDFEHYQPPFGPPLPPQAVRSLLALPNGDLWVGYWDSGVSLLRNGSNRNYTPVDGLPAGRVLGMVQDRRGAIWAGTRNGLARFDGTRWRQIGVEDGFKGRTAASVYLDRNGTLWVASEETISFLPPGETQFHPTGDQVGQVSQILQSPNGTLWMAETTRSVRVVPPSAKDPEIKVGSEQVRFARDGSLWITSVGDGLRRVRFPDRLNHEKIGQFSNQAEIFTAKDGLTADYCTSIYEDREGNIWVGSVNGIDRFTNGAIVQVPVPGKVDMVLLAGDNGDVWVGNFSGKDGRIHGYKWYPVEGRNASSAVRDPHGGIWSASLNEIDHVTHGRLTSLPFPKAYAAVPVTTLALDRSGTLWAAGAKGIFSRRGDQWQPIDPPAGFTGKSVTSSYLDPRGRLWFPYEENTILLIDGPPTVNRRPRKKIAR